MCVSNYIDIILRFLLIFEFPRFRIDQVKEKVNFIAISICVTKYKRKSLTMSRIENQWSWKKLAQRNEEVSIIIVVL